MNKYWDAWMDDHKEDHSNLKEPLEGTAPTNYRPVPTDDVENTNSTN